MKYTILAILIFVASQVTAQQSTTYTIDTLSNKYKVSVTYNAGDTMIYTARMSEHGRKKDVRQWITAQIDREQSIIKQDSTNRDEIDDLRDEVDQLKIARNELNELINQRRAEIDEKVRAFDRPKAIIERLKLLRTEL